MHAIHIIQVEAEALEYKVRYSKKKFLLPETIEHFSELKDFRIPAGPLKISRIPAVIKVTRMAREKFCDFLPLSSHITGLFILARSY